MENMMVMSPGQAIAYRRLACIQKVEVKWSDKWEFVYQPNLSIYRKRSELRKRNYANGVFTAEYHFLKDVPDEEAIVELKAFLQTWRDRGLDALADKVWTQTDWEGDEYPISKVLTKKVPEMIKVRIEDAKFFIERELTPVEMKERGLKIPFEGFEVKPIEGASE